MAIAPVKKTNKIYSTYLTLKLGLVCLYIPLKSIIYSWFNLNTIQNNNKLTRKFAYYILKPLKINFIKNNWQILENLPTNRPIIIMSNHSSLYDIPILLHNMPENISLRMLAKKELKKIPIFGPSLKALGFPTVDRHDRKQAIKDLEHTKKLMQSGITLWVAPEGTRSHDGSLLKFKKGVFIMAIELGAIIVPIGIKGANKVLPAKSYDYSLNETVTLTVQQPIDTANYSLENRNAIIAQTREAIEQAI